MKRQATDAKARAEQAAAAKAALPDTNKLVLLLEYGTKTMQEIAEHFNCSTVKLRPVLQEAINSGDLELRNHRYLLGPRFDPKTSGSCAAVAVEAVRELFIPGRRITALKAMEVTRLQRNTIDLALTQLEKEGYIQTILVQQLRLYERS